jgi:hypothetical protein
MKGLCSIVLRNAKPYIIFAVMDMLSPKFEYNILKFPTQMRLKEWWFTGFYDAKSGIYFSFFCARLNVIDQFSLSIFDPKLPEPIHFSKRMYLRTEIYEGGFSMAYAAKTYSFSFRGETNGRLFLHLAHPRYTAKLNFEPSLPPFTKLEDNGKDWYGFVHQFGLQTNGQFSLDGVTHKVANALAYSDHNFGKLPSNCRWHWLAVQHETISIASLVNYGPNGQCYTQVLVNDPAYQQFADRWIRLSASVTFELNPLVAIDAGEWQLTSPDIELHVSPQQQYLEQIALPPILPVFVKIAHREMHVKVHGRIRLEGNWIVVDGLHGVAEAHFGRW